MWAGDQSLSRPLIRGVFADQSSTDCGAKILKKWKNNENTPLHVDPNRPKALAERCIITVATIASKNEFRHRPLRATVEFWVQLTYGQSRAGPLSWPNSRGPPPFSFGLMGPGPYYVYLARSRVPVGQGFEVRNFHFAFFARRPRVQAQQGRAPSCSRIAPISIGQFIANSSVQSWILSAKLRK